MTFPTSTANKPCKHGHASTRDKRGKCHECLRIRARKRYAKDPQKDKARRNRHPETLRAYERKHREANPEQYMLRAAVNRAKKAGYVCTITETDIVIPEFCPLLGLKLERGTGRHRPGSPSLDKIRPELGYVPGNVWVISHRANELKRDATLAELQMLVERLASVLS